MSLSGLESGLKQGRLQGRKTGLGMSNMKSGLHAGRVNGVANKDKMQDPVLISSARLSCPFMYWNADNVTLSGSSVTAITNLLGQYNPLTQSTISSFTITGTLTYTADTVFNNRASLSLTTSSTVFGVLGTSVPNMTNSNEMTLMVVCKLVASSRSVIFWKKDVNSDPAFADTTGDLSVEFDGTNINVFFIGSPTTQTAQYRAVDATLKNNWVLITVKARLYSPTGAGSFLDIFVNGKRCKQVVTDTISFGTLPVTTWSNAYIQFGNTNGTNGGNLFAAGFITEEWMNESEQLRLENYFRWYYGYNF